MKWVEKLCLAYVNDSYIYGYLARRILRDTSIYVVPMINPDGVNLVTNAIPKDSKFFKQAEKISADYPAILREGSVHGILLFSVLTPESILMTKKK